VYSEQKNKLIKKKPVTKLWKNYVSDESERFYYSKQGFFPFFFFKSLKKVLSYVFLQAVGSIHSSNSFVQCALAVYFTLFPSEITGPVHQCDILISVVL